MTPDREERLVLAAERIGTGLLRIAAALEADSRPSATLPPDSSWARTEPIGGEPRPSQWPAVATLALILLTILGVFVIFA